MERDEDGLLSPLIQMVDQQADPSHLAAHLATATFHGFAARACAIHVRSPGHEQQSVLLVGHHGLSAKESRACLSIDVDFPLPAAADLHRSQPTVRRTEEIERDFPLHRPRLEPDGCLLSMPMRAQGRTLGVALINLGATLQFSSRIWSLLAGVQGALNVFTQMNAARWLPTTPNPYHRSLTQRQLAILRLVPLGLTNHAIGHRLGYSTSTIKADIHKAMVSLVVSDRFEAAAAAQRWMTQPSAASES